MKFCKLDNNSAPIAKTHDNMKALRGETPETHPYIINMIFEYHIVLPSYMYPVLLLM